VVGVESRPAPPAGVTLVAGLPPARFALLLGALIFAAFPQILLGLQSFAIRDFGFFAYPVAQYQRECFWRGELPLWNPYNNCGLPFLAQWNTMPLYPPALLYLLLPLTWSLSAFCLGHLFWAGLGMYFLARCWTGSELGGAVAGLIFGFNGFALNLLMWPSHIATLSWIPWVVLAAERAWSEGGRRIITAAIVGGLQMLAGGPETIFFTWLICLALWTLHLAGLCAARNFRGLLKPLLIFPGTVLLVSGLCAAQLLPFLDLAGHSQREAGFADARWSMPSWGWANFLAPMVFGTVTKQGLFFQHGQYWTSSYYLGIGALLLAGVGLRSTRDRRLALLGAIGAVGLILATGDQTALSRWARALLPQLSLMTYPVKFVLLVVFVVPMAAGFGSHWLQRSAAEPRAQQRLLLGAALLAALLAAVLFWAGRFPLPGDSTAAALRNGLWRAVLLLLISGVLLAMARSGRRPSLAQNQTNSRLWPWLLLPLLWLDVWTHEPQQNPGVPTWVYTPGLAAQKLELKPQPRLGESRVMLSPAAETKFGSLALGDPKANYLVKRLGFFGDCNLLDNVPKVNGFYSLQPRECGELNSTLYVSGVPFGEALVDFMSVSHVTAPDEQTQWKARTTFLPLVTAGQRPVFLDDTNALRTLLSSQFDPRQVVLLPLGATVPALATNNVSARVTAIRVTARQVEFQVETPEPTFAVIGQTYYHSWHGYVDGKPETLLRANYAFQALPVRAGAHRVELKYEDRAFKCGSLISLATLLGLLLAWTLAQRLGVR
jgi:hypothetical protein